MRILRKQLEDALSILEKNDAENKTRKVRKALKEICEDMDRNGCSNEADLIDRNAYIATILWQEDDIRQALREYGIRASKDNIDKVICEIDTDEMENCEHGWDVINDTISRIF